MNENPNSAASQQTATGRVGSLKLIGIGGLVKGEQFTIEVGQTIVIGRSSECDICLKNVPAAWDMGKRGESVEEHFRTVSRKHVRIYFHAVDNIEIADMSSNGVFLNGKRIEGKARITDITSTPHELRLGSIETFLMDWWKASLRGSDKVKVNLKRPAGDSGASATGSGNGSGTPSS